MRSLLLYSLSWLLLCSNLFAQNPTGMYTTFLQQDWQFRQAGAEHWLPATVPGTVHTDLMANGRIPDPYFRTNETLVQWVDKVDWEYRTVITAGRDLLERENIQLVFHGLDTYADVYLNDQFILSADNFFRTWTVDIRNLLREGTNELSVYFHSPIDKGLALLENHGYPLPASNDQAANGGLGDKKVSIFTRKPGYHYGWDWGPRLVTSGIWRPVELRAWDAVVLEDLFFEQRELTVERATLSAHFELTANRPATALIRVKHDDRTLSEQTIRLMAGAHTYALPVEIRDPQRWWTRELGEPHRYALRGEVVIGGEVQDQRTHNIGLRTIRIVQEPDSLGTSFYFELNGVPVFAKGANIIPNDLFLPRVDPARHAAVVQAAVDANMNMLRVWGGGIYEDDVFYDLCDRQGILVWQDFMFACSMYPGDEAFLQNVKREAVQNIRRLRNHPSIALWCGNNEIDVAWAQYKEKAGWGWKQRYDTKQREEIWNDYQAVFHDLLPGLVAEHAPGVFYWPSSPYHSPGKHATYSTTTGDIHYWGVWHGQEPFSAFHRNIGRFMSEYGFQSFPEFNTVKKYTLPEDWDIESEVMAHHQRSGIGNLRIRSYMEDLYRAPEQFKHLLYVGQLLQAEGIKTAIESHRMAKPFCMGTLYWQHNDCWPVASWSGMDYYLNWKAMHYFVRDAFKPVMVAALEKENHLDIYVVSDRLEPFPARLELKLLDFGGNELWSDIRNITVKANTSALYASPALPDLLAQGEPGEMVLQMTVRSDEGTEHTNLFYFVPPKALQLDKKPAVEVSLTWVDDHFQITLKTDRLVKNLYLTSGELEGFFSDNYFDLLPGQPRVLTFKPKAIPEGTLNLQLEMISLGDVK